MNRINWTAVIVLSVVGLLVLLVGASLLSGWGSGGWGRMGPGMMGWWGMGPFGWFGMIFIWLIPVGLLVLLALGIAWLVRAVVNPGGSAAPARACPNCGRNVQPDWHTCPYCGQALE
jgi:hypothetical protein